MSSPPSASTSAASNKGVAYAKRSVYSTRKRGSLKSMLKMPLDIFIEIIAYLSPADLLSLARTSKDLRAFLLNRGSALFWRVSRAKVSGLPPCPADMSEPTYANLMFGTHCHLCLQKDCDDVFWECRARLCKKCVEKSSEVGWGSSAFVYLKQANALSEVAHSMCCDLVPTLLGTRNTSSLHFTPQWNAFAAQVDALEDKPAELAIFLQAQSDSLEEIRRTVPTLWSWYATEQSKSARIAKVRAGRHREITNNLRQMGYGAELDWMNTRQQAQFARTPEVHKALPLSPQVWTKIKDPILRVMDAYRSERLRELRRTAIGDRMKILDELLYELFPTFHRLGISQFEVAFSVTQVRQLIEPTTVEFSKDMLAEAVKKYLPPYLDQRLRGAQELFGNLVREAADFDIAPSTNPLSLAISSSFACECGRSCSFPGILKQYCCSLPRWYMQDDFALAANQVFGRWQHIWEPKRYTTDVERIARCVRACGLDPAVATVEDMDKCGARLFCPTHDISTGRRSIVLHTWRTCCEFARCAGCKPINASADQTATVVQQDAIRREIHYLEREASESSVWRCARCPELASAKNTWAVIRTHLQAFHGIAEPQEDDFIGILLPFRTPHSPIHLFSAELEGSHELTWTDRLLFENHEAVFFKSENL